MVDDREENLLALEAVLSSGQYRLVRAYSGPEAIEKTKSREFALILLDVQMPGMDGFEVARRIRSEALRNDSPIIFLTAINQDERHIHMGYDLGAVDYLFKPFDVVALRSKVAVFADLFRKDRKIREQEALLQKAYERSETRFRAFFDQSSLPMQIFDRAGRSVGANLAWERLFDAPREALEDYCVFEDPQIIQNNLVDNFKRGFAGEPSETLPVYYDPVAIGRKGRARWLEAFIYPVKDEAGNIREVALILKDVTEQVLACKQVEESELRFRTLADSLPELVWSTLPDSTPVYFNARWTEYFGAATAGRYDWPNLVHPDDYPRLQERLQRSYRTGEPLQKEFRLRRKDGQYRWFLARGLPIRDERGDIQRWLGTCTDITETMETKVELEKAVKARDEFLSIASHELRTPVTSMTLNTQMLKRQMSKMGESALTPERMSKLLDQTDRQLGRLTRLIEDMLDIARINTGRFTMQPEGTDLSALVTETVERMSPQLSLANCPVTLDIEPSLAVTCDKIRVEQALSNLLTNALRYGAGKPVHVSLKRSGSMARIDVRDEGVGIDPTDQSRIFKRFERAISFNEVSGLGLGLYIVNLIMEAHGGSAQVQSELGKGSTFSLLLPLNTDS